MKVLVTGAGGCIGAWAVKRLLDSGDLPVAFDLSESRRRLALLDERADSVAWETGDIADDKRVTEVCDKHKPDAILHLAALQVPFCKADPIAGARANVVGTVNVFQAARELGIARLAYASSVAAAAMGEDSEWLETLYGAYKFCGEQLARVYWEDWQVPSVGIRPNVVYGPARDQGMSSKPTVAMLAAAAGVPYVIPFSGRVGFVYASQTAAAFVQAVSAERKGAGVYDLNGTPETVERVVEMIRARKPEADIRCEGGALPFPSETSDQPLRDAIGDYPQWTFEEGLDETMGMFEALLGAGKLSGKDVDQ